MGLLLAAVMLVNGCQDIGRALVKSGHSYRNDNGIVVKYTGSPKDFKDTVRAQSLDPFQNVEVQDGLRVNIIPASKRKVMVLGGYDHRGTITTNQEGSTLKIHPSEKMRQTDDFIRNLKVNVFTPKLSGIHARAFSTVSLRDSMHTQQLKVQVQQHSTIKGTAQVKQLKAQVASHSDLDLKGALNRAEVTTVSHSDIHLRSFEGKGRLKVNLSSHSEGTFEGKVSKVKGEITSHSSIQGADLSSANGQISLGSHSDGIIGVADSLWVDCGSHCDLEVKGSPVLQQKEVARFGDVQIRAR
jgi:hypothetical protein